MAIRIGHWFTGTTLVYHCDTLRKIGGFDTAYKGLADMFAALTIASIKGASFSPEPFGVMRKHAGGLMTSTSTDLHGLDIILERMTVEGPKLSPNLFTGHFCDIMQRRIRFTAIRTFKDESWVEHASEWRGRRYKLLRSITPMFGRMRLLRLAVAFFLLRPLLDLFYIIWFRLLGSVFVMVRMGSAY